MIKFSDIEDAFFFVSSDNYGMHTALLNKDTGQLYYRSAMGDLDEMDDEDFDWNNCISIPHRNDLGMGQELVFEFVKNHLVDEYDQVRQIFKKRGAYGNFKNLLASRDLLQNWYDFENQQEARALRNWCEENGIQISD
jgi:hypothetical protein